MRILFIEDNAVIRERVAGTLRESGFVIEEVDMLAGARQALSARSFDLVLLDILLPDGNGIELLRELRNGRNAQMPVIILSTLGEMVDERISGLEAGANDYLAKPFSTRELIARIRALTRNLHSEFFRLNGGKMSLLQPVVLKDDGKRIVLSMKEFQLLRHLAENQGRFVPVEEILSHVWKVNPLKSQMTSPVVFVSRLRSKLVGLCEIETERNAGYRLHVG